MPLDLYYLILGRVTCRGGSFDSFQIQLYGNGGSSSNLVPLNAQGSEIFNHLTFYLSGFTKIYPTLDSVPPSLFIKNSILISKIQELADAESKKRMKHFPEMKDLQYSKVYLYGALSTLNPILSTRENMAEGATLYLPWTELYPLMMKHNQFGLTIEKLQPDRLYVNAEQYEKFINSIKPKFLSPDTVDEKLVFTYSHNETRMT